MGGWEAELPCGDQILVTLDIDESGMWVIGRYRWCESNHTAAFVTVGGFATDDDAKAFAAQLREPNGEETFDNIEHYQRAQ